MPIMMVLKALREMPLEQHAASSQPGSVQHTPVEANRSLESPPSDVIRFASNVATPDLGPTDEMCDRFQLNPTQELNHHALEEDAEMVEDGTRDLYNYGSAAHRYSHLYPSGVNPGGRQAGVDSFGSNSAALTEESSCEYDQYSYDDPYTYDNHYTYNDQYRYNNNYHGYDDEYRSARPTFDDWQMHNLLGLIQQTDSEIRRANTDLDRIQESLMRMEAGANHQLQMEWNNLAQLTAVIDQMDTALCEEHADHLGQ